MKVDVVFLVKVYFCMYDYFKFVDDVCFVVVRLFSGFNVKVDYDGDVFVVVVCI